MRFRSALLLALILILAIPLGAFAQHGGHDHNMDNAPCSGVAILGGYARASVSTTAAAYATVVNFGPDEVTLIGGATPAAEVVEIHTMSVVDDVMSMMPLSDGLTIPASGVAILQPGGLHLMFINLTDILEAGQTLDLSLEFADGETISLSLPIQPVGEAVLDPTLAADPQAEDFSAWLGNLGTINYNGTDCEGLHMVLAGIEPLESDPSSAQVYGWLLNFDAEHEALLNIESDAAEAAAVYEAQADAPAITHENAILVPAGGWFALRPDGVHLRLLDLATPLAMGDSVSLGLGFSMGHNLTLDVSVMPWPPHKLMHAGGMMGGMDMNHGGEMNHDDDSEGGHGHGN